MDEIKKIAIVKEVNLTQVREQIKNQEEMIKRQKEDLEERMSVADKLTEEEKDKVFGREIAMQEANEKSLAKAKAYLKDVEEAEPVEEIEKGKAVKGEINKALKDAV